MDAQIISSIILGVVAIGVTWFYSFGSSKREKDRMMKDLFSEFNSRYDKLNDSLATIEANYKDYNHFKELRVTNADDYKKLKQDVIDFFNLCAEEYYWHQKKRIDQKIWRSWHAGMNYWYNNVPTIKKLWQLEVEAGGTTSYYLNGKERFFVDNA
jgi:hypothetical protein